MKILEFSVGLLLTLTMGCGTSQNTPNHSSSGVDSYPSERESRNDDRKNEREKTDRSTAVKTGSERTRTVQAGPSGESSSSEKKKKKQTPSARDKKGIHYWLRKTKSESTEHHKQTRENK